MVCPSRLASRIAAFFALTFFLITNVWPQTSEQSVIEVCRIRSGQDGDAFNRCVASAKVDVANRRQACARELRAWVIPSEEQASLFMRCMSATSVEVFRKSFASSRSVDSAKVPVPIRIDPDQLRHWEIFDRNGDIDVRSVYSALWDGAVIDGLPSGRGELTIRLRYRISRLTAFGGDVENNGEMVLRGNFRQGRLDGMVELLAHPIFGNIATDPSVNKFSNGINLGFPLSDQCKSNVPRLEPDIDIEWFGVCRGNMPYAGLVVSKSGDRYIDISCFQSGKISSREQLDAFNACEPYWKYLPNFCKFGNYRGQCAAGKPSGVGVLVETRREQTFNETPGGFAGALAALGQATAPSITAHRIMRGQFNETLSGYGYRGEVSSCGPAGCSGPVVHEIGLFDSGSLRVSCATWRDCASRDSGASYTSRQESITAERLAQLRAKGDFDSALEAFAATKDRGDLRQASNLARTRIQSQRLEHTMLRVIGYERAFMLSAFVRSGSGERTSLQESSNLLGYVRNTRADTTLSVDWEIRNDTVVAPLRVGRYTVHATFGLEVTVRKKLCISDFCRNEDVKERFEKPVKAVLTPGNKVSFGTFDMNGTASSLGVIFGSINMTDIIDVIPWARVEKVEEMQ